MKIYVITEYTYDYEYVPSIYDDDWDEDTVESTEFKGIVTAFTNKTDAERWIAEQELKWDGQYEIEECELR